MKKGGVNMNVKDENSFEVEYKYDVAYDVFAIKVKRSYDYGKTVEMAEGVLLDFDSDNIPVALEILDASKRFNVPKYSLKDLICFNMNVNINPESININVTLGVMIHNKEQSHSLDYLTSNLSGIPSMETELVTA